MIKLSNVLLIIAATFIIGGLITNFGLFYIAALTCLLTGSSIAINTLCDEVCELETELFHRKRAHWESQPKAPTEQEKQDDYDKEIST